MSFRGVWTGLAATAALSFGAASAAVAADTPELTPTGQAITPMAATGAVFQTLNPDLPGVPDYTAGQASSVALSPDGKTLLVLTSGFNRLLGPDGKAIPERSNEYIFVYDVSGATPVKRQVLTAPNTFIGIAWAPRGDRFFVSAGDDDAVLEYVGAAGRMRAGRRFALGHAQGLGLKVKPETAGLAVSPDGRRLLAANVQNDTVSLVDLVTGKVTETDLRPGVIDPKRSGQAGGSYPRAAVFVSNTRAYVASERDREVIALDVGPSRVRVAARVKTVGQPVALAARAGRLYAALDNSDAVAVIDTVANRIVETIPTAAPQAMLGAAKGLGGAGTNALALSPDGRTLLVTNGGENAVAVVALGAAAAGAKAAKPSKGRDADGDGDDDDDKVAGGAKAASVVGLIPTGWYPTGVAMRPDGRQIYVVNGKSNAGPNPAACRNTLSIAPGAEDACRASNSYVWQLEKAGFLTLPAPPPAELGRLTQIAAVNNHFGRTLSDQDAATLAFLKGHIRHVIYIVKENRTYDQLLGDLEVGNGDPKLAVFGAAITPNQHALARQFVDLDAFFDSGESSNTGWNWTTAGRTNDWTEREAPVNYANRGLQYDQEGDNRGLNMGFATEAQRVAANPLAPKDPNILPGARDVAAPDGPGGAEGKGYIWDGALRAGLTVRNWGFYGDLTLYYKGAGAARTPLERDPFKAGVKVFTPAKAALMERSDLYYRGFDQAFPDFWRFQEWAREFDGFAAKGEAPNLMLVRLPHDHTGSFDEGIDGVNTVETEQADNDYAVGLLVEKVAKSPFAKDTLIMVVEDDAQDGPDHVDAHRSLALIAGPYVKQGAVVSTRYTTVDLVRTIEAVLGIAPLGLNDALAIPMSQVFDPAQASWTYQAKVPAVLRTTKLPLPPATAAEAACPAHSAHDGAWWAAAMAGQDFSREDRLDTAAFNQALWRGLRGNTPYPTQRDGRDLSQGRVALLAAAGREGCE